VNRGYALEIKNLMKNVEIAGNKHQSYNSKVEMTSALLRVKISGTTKHSYKRKSEPDE
jgi:hypothetical protein